MKKILQAVHTFCGRNDWDDVHLGTHYMDSEEYNIALFGKIRHISKNGISPPMLSFPYFTNPSAGAYYEVFACGNYYFKKDDVQFRPLDDLSRYFGIAVQNLNFSGYMYNKDIGILGIVAFGDELYMTKQDRVYHKIGQKSQIIPKGIVSLYFEDTTHIAVSEEGRYYRATVTFSNTLIPTIKLDEELTLGLEYKLLRYTCCGVLLSQGKFNYTYVNRVGGFLNANNWVTPSTKTTGIYNLDFSSAGSTIGSHYYYTIQGADEKSKVALPYEEIQICDGVPSTLEMTYNEKRQLKQLDERNTEWNTNMMGLVQSFLKSTSYEYVWETELSYAKTAQNAIALINKTTESNTSVIGANVIVQKSTELYSIRKDKSGQERLIYQKLTTVDGLEKEINVELNEIRRYDSAGHPLLTGAIKTTDSLEKRLYSAVLYSKKAPSLLVATYDNVWADGNNYAAAYTGFGMYEDIEINAAGNITAPGFILLGGKLTYNPCWGERCVYFDRGGYIQLDNTVYTSSLIKSMYLLNVICKKADSKRWELLSQYMDPQNFPGSRIIMTVPEKTYICAILFRTVDCETKAYMYDGKGRKTGYLDNNFIPHYWVLDKVTNSVLCEYILDVVQQGDQILFNDKIALNNIEIYGYAKFNGYNRSQKYVQRKSKYNTILQLRFRENGEIIYYGDDNYKSIPSNSFVLFGQGAVALDILGEPTITLRLTKKSIELYNSSSVPYPTTTILSLGDEVDPYFTWFVIEKNGLLMIVINGKLEYAVTLYERNIRGLQLKDNSHEEYNACQAILIPNIDIIMNYYDYVGKLLQTQSVRIMHEGMTRLVIDAYIYNNGDQLIARCLKGTFPVDTTSSLRTEDKPLFYRENFAHINWNEQANSADSRGILTGELADYYRVGAGSSEILAVEDYKYPYYYYEHEENGNLRPLKQIQPGKNGYMYQEEYTTHDDETYTLYASQFDPLEVDYTATKSSNLSSLNYYHLVDSTPKIHGEAILTQENPRQMLQYRILNGLRVSPLPGVHKVGIGTTYYQPERPLEPMLQRYSVGYNRINVDWGTDRGERILITDIAGNGRIAFNGSSIEESNAVYYKYDHRNRIIELGQISFANTVTWEELLTYTLNSEFPNGKETGVTNYVPKIKFEYDTSNHGFSAGRLTKAISPAEDYYDEYFYDYWGRVTKHIVHYEKYNIVEEYTRDNLFNLMQIRYDQQGGKRYELLYSYRDNEPVQILYNSASSSKRIVDNAKYDIYKRLISYTDCCDRMIHNRYDLLGRQFYIGEEGDPNANYVHKVYTEDSTKGQRLQRVTYSPEKYNKDYTYDSFLRLSAVSEAERGIRYDKNGNVSQFSMNGTTYPVTYEGVNKLKRAKGATFTYGSDGNVIRKDEGSSYIYITQSQLYFSKIEKLSKNILGHLAYVFNFIYNANGEEAVSIRDYQGALSPIAEVNLYSEDGRLLETRTYNAEIESRIYNVFIGNRQVAQMQADGKWIGTCYDDNQTLYMLSRTNRIDMIKYNAWGYTTANETTMPCYRGMKYLPDVGLYLNHGGVYDSAFGITYSPILESGAFTPYRVSNNTPFV